MKHRTFCCFPSLLLVLLFLVVSALHAEGAVVKDGSRTYLVDQTGERWDITQAVSIGFDPGRFEFGIGRHAFQPLDETRLKPGSNHHHPRMRVIGVAKNGDAHAYSVQTLRYHETANTFLGSEAIVAGY